MDNHIYKKAVRFDKLICASRPLKPARRDIFTRHTVISWNLGGRNGALHDRTLQGELRKHGVYTHTHYTDHAHYFGVGGENTVFPVPIPGTTTMTQENDHGFQGESPFQESREL